MAKFKKKRSAAEKKRGSKKVKRVFLAIVVALGLTFTLLYFLTQPEYNLVRKIHQDEMLPVMTSADLCVDDKVNEKAKKDFAKGMDISELKGADFDDIKAECENRYGQLHFYQGLSVARTKNFKYIKD